MSTLFLYYITTKGQEYGVLVGPFKEKYAQFREKYLGIGRLCEWIHFKYNLLVGCGWIFPMEKLDEIKATLTAEKITFTEEVFDKNVRVQRRKEQRRDYARKYRSKKKLQAASTATLLPKANRAIENIRNEDSYEECMIKLNKLRLNFPALYNFAETVFMGKRIPK